jgi:predicted RecA/RadA family phage recombinase
MANEADYRHKGSTLTVTAGAAYTAGQVIQLNDGRAAVPTSAVASGDAGGFTTCGVFRLAKTASVVVLDGAPIWWDHSANTATPVPPLVAGDRDFYVGCAIGDQTAAATVVDVALNIEPCYIIDLHRDPGDTAIVKTVVGSTTVEVPNLINRGGAAVANFGTTAEAQKVDWLSVRSFALASNWILEAVVEVVANADADVGDLNIGVANGTHASDADSITESCFFHYDMGGSLNILCESDDGTTEVAATDSTKDWAVGVPDYLVLDGRDPSDVLFYVNGVEVLNATANLGNIAAATGPLKALFHLEKTSNDAPGTVSLSALRVRTAEQD